MEAGNAKIVVQVEIWQAQNYWPIKGWASPLSGTPHYSCTLLGAAGSETFPEDLATPSGWEWVDRWNIDSSTKFGSPDMEGWFYGSTFDRLGDMLKTATGTGVASKTSLVRKRRWIRTMQCASVELCDAIRARVDAIMSMRQNIVGTLKAKEESIRGIQAYETHRSKVFSHSLALATQGTLNLLSQLKHLGIKLRTLKQYFVDRIALEKEYAGKLDVITKKYLLPPSLTDPRSTTKDSLYGLAQGDSNDMSQEISMQGDIVYAHLHAIAQMTTNTRHEFASNLLQSISMDIDSMLLELQTVLKETRTSFRKNSDICRLSEAAVRNFLSSVNVAFETVGSASLLEITELSDELNALKGGVAFNPSHFTNVRPVSSTQQLVSSHSSNSSSGGIAREDIFLGIQRYKLAVKDSVEALCVIVAEHLDLSLQLQIYCNRIYNLFNSLAHTYQHEEVTLYHELCMIWHEMSKDMIERLSSVQVPFEHIQSPFTQLEERLRVTMAPPENKEEGTEGEEEDSEEVIDFSAKKHAVPAEKAIAPDDLFAFTSLYATALPPSPGVIRSGDLLYTTHHEFYDNLRGDALSANIWRTAYVIATSDGFVHVITRRKSDIPDRTFAMKTTSINEARRSGGVSLPAEIAQVTFELAVVWNRQQPSMPKPRAQAMFHEGFVFRAPTSSDCSAWVASLHSLTAQASYVDHSVEADSLAALLSSLPILKGETVKVNLERRKYQELYRSNHPSSSISDAQVEAMLQQAQSTSPMKSDQREMVDKVLSEADIESDNNKDNGKDEYGIAVVETMEQGQIAGGDSDEDNDDEEDQLLEQTPATATATAGNPQGGNGNAYNEEGGSGLSRQPSSSTNSNNNSFRRIASNSNNNASGTNSERTPPKVLSRYQFGSQYKKGDSEGGWRSAASSSTDTSPKVAGIIVGATPVDVSISAKVPRLIPKTDDNTPLARRHTALIQQYEQGLQQEKQKVSLRVKESKGRRLQEAEQLPLLASTNSDPTSPAPDKGSSPSGEDSALLSPVKMDTDASAALFQSPGTEPETPTAAGEGTSAAEETSAKKQARVKRLSQMFGTPSSEALKSPTKPNP